MQKFLEPIIGKFDGKVFYPTILTLLGVVLLGIIDPTLFTRFFNPLTNWVVVNCAWVVKWFSFIVVVFLAIIAFSKYGNIKLGKDEDVPEYSTFSWISMCICCGIGFGAFLWFASEGLYHLFQSPMIKADGNMGKAAGIPLALASSYMDWGISAWAMFALCGLGVALPAFRMDKPFNLAGGLYGLLGDKAYTSGFGKASDFAGAIASAAGPSAGLGFGIMIISSGIAAITGIKVGLPVQVGIVLFFCFGFIISSYIGIDKGMKRLSGLCVYVTIFFTLFIFLTGPTLFIANAITESVGVYLSQFISLNFFSDAGGFVVTEAGKSEYKPDGWHSWWYVFYMVWWVAYAPYSGGFLARISRGRTLRQFICGSILLPTSLMIFVIGTWSSAAAYIQVSGQADLYSMLLKDAGGTIYEILNYYPLSKIGMGLIVFVCAILGITTFDSVTYFVSVQTSHGDINPKPAMKLLWGFTLGGLALTFLTIGNFDGLKGLGLLAGIPFFFYMIAIMFSIAKMLKLVENKEM